MIPKGGDKLKDLSARELGDAINAGRWWRREQMSGGHLRYGDTPEGGAVFAKNSTGVDLSTGHIAIISGVVFTPTEALMEFQARPTYTVAAPTDREEGRVVVALEPIAVNKIGRVQAFGLARCRVNIEEDCHRWAVAGDSDTTKLTSRPLGSCEIIWSEYATGETWAVVRLSDFGRPRRRFKLKDVLYRCGSAAAERMDIADPCNPTLECEFTVYDPLGVVGWPDESKTYHGIGGLGVAEYWADRDQWEVVHLGFGNCCYSSSSSSGFSSSSSSQEQSSIQVQETDVRCEQGAIQVYFRTATITLSGGRLSIDRGQWTQDHTAGCCGCPSSSSSSSSSSAISSSSSCSPAQAITSLTAVYSPETGWIGLSGYLQAAADTASVYWDEGDGGPTDYFLGTVTGLPTEGGWLFTEQHQAPLPNATNCYRFVPFNACGVGPESTVCVYAGSSSSSATSSMSSASSASSTPSGSSASSATSSVSSGSSSAASSTSSGSGSGCDDPAGPLTATIAGSATGTITLSRTGPSSYSGSNMISNGGTPTLTLTCTGGTWTLAWSNCGSASDQQTGANPVGLVFSLAPLCIDPLSVTVTIS